MPSVHIIRLNLPRGSAFFIVLLPHKPTSHYALKNNHPTVYNLILRNPIQPPHVLCEASAQHVRSLNTYIKDAKYSNISNNTQPQNMFPLMRTSTTPITHKKQSNIKIACKIT